MDPLKRNGMEPMILMTIQLKATVTEPSLAYEYLVFRLLADKDHTWIRQRTIVMKNASAQLSW